MAQLESFDHILCYYLEEENPVVCSSGVRDAETLRKRLKTLKNIAVKYKFQILSAFYSDVPFDKPRRVRRHLMSRRRRPRPRSSLNPRLQTRPLRLLAQTRPRQLSHTP